MMSTADLPPSRLAGRNILIVEDEALLAFDLLDELEAAGAIPIGPAVSVDQAIELIKIQALDAALLNVFLRSKPSFPVADALMARAIPFLFVTGNDAFVHEHYPDVPAHPKPYDMPKVVAALERLLREKASYAAPPPATDSMQS